MRYDDGEEILAGDEVDLDGDAATVETVIESPEVLEDYGLSPDQPGVMFHCRRMGAVFEPRDSGCWNAILLVRRWSPPKTE